MVLAAQVVEAAGRHEVGAIKKPRLSAGLLRSWLDLLVLNRRVDQVPQGADPTLLPLLPPQQIVQAILGSTHAWVDDEPDGTGQQLTGEITLEPAGGLPHHPVGCDVGVEGDVHIATFHRHGSQIGRWFELLRPAPATGNAEGDRKWRRRRDGARRGLELRGPLHQEGRGVGISPAVFEGLIYPDDSA